MATLVVAAHPQNFSSPRQSGPGLVIHENDLYTRVGDTCRQTRHGDEDERLKFTRYFAHTRTRPDRLRIRDDWIERIIRAPEHEEVQSDSRIRRWGYIPEEGRYLQVVLLPDGETVHNAFFDRSFRERKK